VWLPAYRNQHQKLIQFNDLLAERDAERDALANQVEELLRSPKSQPAGEEVGHLKAEIKAHLSRIEEDESDNKTLRLKVERMTRDYQRMEGKLLDSEVLMRELQVELQEAIRYRNTNAVLRKKINNVMEERDTLRTMSEDHSGIKSENSRLLAEKETMTQKLVQFRELEGKLKAAQEENGKLKTAAASDLVSIKAQIKKLIHSKHWKSSNGKRCGTHVITIRSRKPCDICWKTRGGTASSTLYGCQICDYDVCSSCIMRLSE